MGSRSIPCPIPGCGTLVKRDRLMCSEHWGMVPKRLQIKVNRTWRALWKNRRDSTAFFAARREYEQTRDNALQAVTAVLP